MSVWLPRRPPPHLARHAATRLANLHGTRRQYGLYALVNRRHQGREVGSSLNGSYTITLRAFSTTRPTEAEEKVSSIATADDKNVSKPTDPPLPLQTRVWNKVKHEAAHYYHGSKLLGKEIRISSRLLLKVMRGMTLTRRESRQVSCNLHIMHFLYQSTN